LIGSEPTPMRTDPDAGIQGQRMPQTSAAELFGGDLINVNLSNADLTNAFLADADLTRSGFIGTDLTEAILTQANLTRAALHQANLIRAVLDGEPHPRDLATGCSSS
jgi:uncharacterized protein YjbI with pentapeptide repeats